MKKFFINICLVLIAFVIYFLQSNFFNWFSIGGVKPNLFIIYILWIGLFGNKTMGVIYGMITGTFLDLLFYEKVGTNLIALTLIGIIAIIFNKIMYGYLIIENKMKITYDVYRPILICISFTIIGLIIAVALAKYEKKKDVVIC